MAESMVGPLGPDVTIERVTFGSCTHQGKPMPHWAEVAATRPQLLLLTGDNVYGDATSGDPKLPELRAAYAALAADPGFGAIRASVPIMATWDDHDYGDNDAGGEFPHKALARQLFLDFWAPSAEDPRRLRAEGVYSARIHGPEGRRVQIIMLDTRSFRSPLKPTDAPNTRGKERYLPDRSPEKTMLGDTQWAWLAEQLRRPAEVRLIVSSTQVLAEDHGFECWHNLPAERDKLIALIEETRAKGVILISGDRHMGGLYRRAEGTPYPLTEITASAFNVPVSLPPQPAGPHMSTPLYQRLNFGLAQIDWARRQISLTLQDARTGEVARAVTVPLSELSVPGW